MAGAGVGVGMDVDDGTGAGYGVGVAGAGVGAGMRVAGGGSVKSGARVSDIVDGSPAHAVSSSAHQENTTANVAKGKRWQRSAIIGDANVAQPPGNRNRRLPTGLVSEPVV